MIDGTRSCCVLVHVVVLSVIVRSLSRWNPTSIPVVRRGFAFSSPLRLDDGANNDDDDDDDDDDDEDEDEEEDDDNEDISVGDVCLSRGDRASICATLYCHSSCMHET